MVFFSNLSSNLYSTLYDWNISKNFRANFRVPISRNWRRRYETSGSSSLPVKLRIRKVNDRQTLGRVLTQTDWMMTVRAKNWVGIARLYLLLEEKEKSYSGVGCWRKVFVISAIIRVIIICDDIIEMIQRQNLPAPHLHWNLIFHPLISGYKSRSKRIYLIRQQTLLNQ